MDVAEMGKVAEFIDAVLRAMDDSTIERVRREVQQLAADFPLYLEPAPAVAG